MDPSITFNSPSANPGYSLLAASIAGWGAHHVAPYLCHVLTYLPSAGVAGALKAHPVASFAVSAFAAFAGANAHHSALYYTGEEYSLNFTNSNFFNEQPEIRYVVMALTDVTAGAAVAVPLGYLFSIPTSVALTLSASGAVAVLIAQTVVTVFSPSTRRM